MNVAKWLLLALLALPLAELAAFIAVASAIGFLGALGLLLATSFAGALVLQHAGGSHIARVRTAWDNGSFTSFASRQQRRPRPVGRDSAANSGVYHRCRRRFAAAVAAAPTRQRQPSAAARRPNAPTAWSICRRKIGTRWPIRRCPTAATTSGKASNHASLFTLGACVSQPPRERKIACPRPMAARRRPSSRNSTWWRNTSRISRSRIRTRRAR